MATFVMTTMSLTDDGGGDLSVDGGPSVLDADIEWLGTAGVTGL